MILLLKAFMLKRLKTNIGQVPKPTDEMTTKLRESKQSIWVEHPSKYDEGPSAAVALHLPSGREVASPTLHSIPLHSTSVIA